MKDNARKMKRVIAMASIMMGVCCLGTYAVDVTVPQVVEVSDQSAKIITPNQMTWWLEVANTDPDQAEAVKGHEVIIQNVVGFLERESVEAKDITKSKMKSEQVESRIRPKKITDGYSVSTQMTFICKDINKYDSLWLGLTQMDSVNLHMVQYDSTDSVGSKQFPIRINIQNYAWGMEGHTIFVGKIIKSGEHSERYVEHGEDGTKELTDIMATGTYSPAVHREHSDDPFIDMKLIEKTFCYTIEVKETLKGIDLSNKKLNAIYRINRTVVTPSNSSWSDTSKSSAGWAPYAKSGEWIFFVANEHLSDESIGKDGNKLLPISRVMKGISREALIKGFKKPGNQQAAPSAPKPEEPNF